MLQSQQIEAMICLIAAMDRDALVRHLRSYPADFPLDFSDGFLSTTPLERLRHIFLAVCLQCQRAPELAATAA